MHQGTIDLSIVVLLVMIPIYESGDICIQAILASSGESVNIEWKPGSVILVQGKSDLRLRGKGRLVCQAFNFAQIQFVRQQ